MRSHYEYLANIPMSEEKSSEKELTKKEEETLHVFFVEKVVTLMTGAMGLVAALAWNDAIRKLFERIFGTQGSVDITAMFVYAAIVTTAVVVVTYRLSKIVQKMKKKNKK
jgi:TRAP-type C4-dicarboxylate transport system permease small subunit